MKTKVSLKSLILLFSFFLIEMKGQVIFSYDNSGKLIERKIQIINPNLRFSTGNYSQSTDSSLSFKIYPNPTNDVINIEGRLNMEKKVAEIMLRNSNGMLIKKDSYDGNLKSINVAELNAGVYFLEIKYAEKNSSNYKIIISN